jgi:membrane-associated protein
VEPDDSSVSYISRAAVLRVLAVLGLLAVVALVLMSVFGADAFGLIEKGSGDPAYLAVFGLVAADAVVPIFPGETTLNAASTLAANGELELVWVIVAGALGSMVGDSALYWIARRNSARIEPRLARARRDPRVEAALDFLDRGAPVLLTFGRYVPGLRFVVNATMGMTGYPYKRFLPWFGAGRSALVGLHLRARLPRRLDGRQLSGGFGCDLRSDHNRPDGVRLSDHATSRARRRRPSGPE